MNEKKIIDRLRTIVARILATILCPTVVYMVGHLSDPEYCPTLGWTATVLMLMAAMLWALYYGIFYYRKEV